MKVMRYSAFRDGLADVLDAVNANHQPIMVSRQNGKPAVVMSLEDFRSYQLLT